jgi:surfeit locus 1 family protein
VTPIWRRFLIPGLSTLVMLVGLIGLGTWQVHRLHWKSAVLAQITTAEASPPVALSPSPALFSKVFASGRFQFDRAVQFGAEVRDLRTGPVMGAYQIVPLIRDNGPTIMVNRGWVPETRNAPLDEPSGLVTVAGYIRSGDQVSWFSANDDIAARRFYTLDTGAMGAAVGVAIVEPFVLVALGPLKPGIFPEPAQQLPRPPNNHLAYVITWYGLAVALVVIFSVWARKASRS